MAHGLQRRSARAPTAHSRRAAVEQGGAALPEGHCLSRPPRASQAAMAQCAL